MDRIKEESSPDRIPEDHYDALVFPVTANFFLTTGDIDERNSFGIKIG